jgi:hypothetical protein
VATEIHVRRRIGRPADGPEPFKSPEEFEDTRKLTLACLADADDLMSRIRDGIRAVGENVSDLLKALAPELAPLEAEAAKVRGRVRGLEQEKLHGSKPIRRGNILIVASKGTIERQLKETRDRLRTLCAKAAELVAPLFPLVADIIAMETMLKEIEDEKRCVLGAFHGRIPSRKRPPAPAKRGSIARGRFVP